MNSLTTLPSFDAEALDTPNVAPHLAVGRWKTFEAIAMRRICTLRNEHGEITAYRPMIQQGRGAKRQTHSEVFRITACVDASMAMAMAQRWRDRKEMELGITSGHVSSKSAERFVPGISLVVSSKEPHRAYWKWEQKGHPKLTTYISLRKNYGDAYAALVERICASLQCAMPETLVIPVPNSVQYARLMKMGIPGLPDRRRCSRSATAG